MRPGCDDTSEILQERAQSCAVLFINLDRSPNRRDFQHAQARRLGLEFERISAVDGAELPDEIYRRYAYRWQRVLTRNEVACLLSHAKCWERTIELACNTLVLEDDAVLAEELPAFLNEAANIAGCLAINIETQCKKAFLAPSRLLRAAPHRLQTAVSGSAGYLVTPQAAAALLKGLPVGASLADNYIWGKRNVTRLQAGPALCMGMDVLQAHFRLEQTRLAHSAIANKVRSRKEKTWSYVRHPMTAIRRLKAQVSLGLAKMILPWFAESRIVSPYPSLLANYQALRGVYNG